MGLKPKFRRRWIGPFTVAKVNGLLSYEVINKDGTKAYRVHAEHMKRVYINHIASGVSLEASSPEKSRRAKLQAANSDEGEDVVA